jgi:hypothetical protein
VVGFDRLDQVVMVDQHRVSRMHKLEPFSAEWWSNITGVARTA